MRELGQASNHAGLAVLDAQTQLAHAAEAFWRSCERSDQRANLMSWVAEEYHVACRDHVERLTAMYAQASAQYAVCAVEAASRVADGQPVTVPASMPAPPSDVLTMAQVHVPLLQIPARVLASQWLSGRAVENAALAADHRRLTAAIAAVESPANAFDDPDKVAERQTAYLLESEFPSALHQYASTCVHALAIMCVPES